MSTIVGVDGCKGGWVAVLKNLRTGEMFSAVYSSTQQLFSHAPDHDVMALDIPIGLTHSGARQCDLLARRMLGRPRGSSVFPAPIRPALMASDRKEADAISRRVHGKGVGAQAFGLYPRIRQVDEFMRRDARARESVYEVHPELCFMALNGGQPVRQAKRSIEGMSARLRLIEAHFGESAVRTVRQAHPAGQVADDDIHDAFAALWTAERILLGIARVIPDPPESDPFGLTMGMWF